MALEIDLDTESTPEASPVPEKKIKKADRFIIYGKNCYVCGKVFIGKEKKHTYKTSEYEAKTFIDEEPYIVEKHIAMHLYCYESWVKPG